MIETLPIAADDDRDRLLHHRRRGTVSDGAAAASSAAAAVRVVAGEDDGCVTMSGSSASAAVDHCAASKNSGGGGGGGKIENCGGEHDGIAGERGSDTMGWAIFKVMSRDSLGILILNGEVLNTKVTYALDRGGVHKYRARLKGGG